MRLVLFTIIAALGDALRLPPASAFSVGSSKPLVRRSHPRTLERALTSKAPRFACAYMNQESTRNGGASSYDLAQKVGIALYPIGKPTKYVVSLAVAMTLLLRRDVPTLTFVVGSIANGHLSKVLKQVLNQRRPDGAYQVDPGMPSSHAQSLFYLSTGSSLALCARAANPPVWLPFRTRVAVLGLTTYATLAALWRVAMGYHTLSQILVGAGVGAGAAFAWLAACRFMNPWVSMHVSEPLPASAMWAICIAGAATVGNVDKLFMKFRNREKAD